MALEHHGMAPESHRLGLRSHLGLEKEAQDSPLELTKELRVLPQWDPSEEKKEEEEEAHA